jgi:hypothetical protein
MRALKAIVSVVPVLLVVLNTVLTALQSGHPLAVSDWMALVSAAAVPVLVFAVPNLPPEVAKNLEALAVLLRTSEPPTNPTTTQTS